MWGKEKYGDRKCINCGYLGKKDTEGYAQTCFIANAEERTTGQLLAHSILGSVCLRTIPWCFADKSNLKDEFESRPRKGLLSARNRDRYALEAPKEQ